MPPIPEHVDVGDIVLMKGFTRRFIGPEVELTLTFSAPKKKRINIFLFLGTYSPDELPTVSPEHILKSMGYTFSDNAK